MLVSPDSAGGDPGRARVVSLGGVLFSFFRQNFPRVNSYVYILYIYIYQSEIFHVRKSVV